MNDLELDTALQAPTFKEKNCDFSGINKFEPPPCLSAPYGTHLYLILKFFLNPPANKYVTSLHYNVQNKALLSNSC